MSIPKRLLGLLLASTSLCSATIATSQDGVSSSASSLNGEEPQGLFRWAMTAEDLGQVAVPAVGLAGWAMGPNGMYYRSVPGFTADPTYEVIIRAPHSGSAKYAERLLVQIPSNFSQKPFDERAVMVGFHSFSVSEKDIFLNTDLPFEAAQRGWLLVAPYGLTDTSFANPQSQVSLEAVFHALFAVVPFNYKRVYAVGFSMGGLNALSYGMRHLDRQQLQFAGIVAHTSTLDMPQEFENSPPVMQWLLSNQRHFQGNLQSKPFEFERVSPVQFQTDGLVDADRAPILNFAGRPIFLHSNLADSHTELVEGMGSLSQFLQQRGANVVEHLVHDPAMGHDWKTLPLASALNYVSAYQVEATPLSSVEVFADNPGRWLHTDVESISHDAFGRFQLEISPVAAGSLNAFALLETRDLNELRVRAPQMGLDPKTSLTVLHESADGTSDLIRIAGYNSAPTSVTVDGAPPVSWNWVGGSREVVIEPTDDGRYARIVVTP